ncbi:hypothetical protein BZG78_07635 [Salinivibrio sp. MA351]|uniref:Transposase n=1 Tax=Salinivibrio costicola subsp. alcaliphilus TaxID=272773 RepID=A0ABX3KP66_SALCS|nr:MULTISPECIES: hypothetical protein [Salinivibrio]OOE92265.1 hypothetical protein BZG76_06860 [Salinivibrio sp. AR647]OOE92676.1 hypothetical protein BZG75_08870 [Salinivibrio sp. AR640]OOE98917.1 hypothetical protein BZG78_07635 [Salinivibrio sp. MA351]OOF02532.1 hypothetical protein BZG80_12220 [Salinivibrio sp. MA440]OOF02759.1 hypothetical protein BZG81_13580 [Salinivibrio sp. MA607]
MFAWLSGLFEKEQLQASVWVRDIVASNPKGSYAKYKNYYDRHINRILKSYHKDFLRFEKFAVRNYKHSDQSVFMAVKVASYAYQLGQLKVAACITAAVISTCNRAKRGDAQVHPKLYRATIVLHKKILETGKTTKKQKSAEPA